MKRQIVNPSWRHRVWLDMMRSVNLSQSAYVDTWSPLQVALWHTIVLSVVQHTLERVRTPSPRPSIIVSLTISWRCLFNLSKIANLDRIHFGTATFVGRDRAFPADSEFRVLARRNADRARHAASGRDAERKRGRSE